MRQPDIEIYLKQAELSAVTQWLSQRLGPLSAWTVQGKTRRCHAGQIPIVWVEQAVGKWHSLVLESDATPWVDDLNCAQEAFQALQIEIRCMPCSWQEDEQEEEADRWLSIGPQGVQNIIWRT
ncbi:hypothetical protein LX59_02439 [Azomonas agilis]|uniref:Uncharacterized protein n=1 Tax=Azomonas agilis TaxID=116849 RepID=A0A562I0E1_9GAMM|nr:hypothetical protein [Azomonas agilis]TWH64491.1 hypothetical protein LX59_02439 [Azomonas agilis]